MHAYNRHESGNFYPGTGYAEQAGSGPGAGYCVNIPWMCRGVGDRDYLSAFEHIVMPIARHFQPDLTIISAGFDAARGDPLGGCDVTPQGYAHMTHLLSSLSQGRLLVVLEGGYNLRSISASANAVMEVTILSAHKIVYKILKESVPKIMHVLKLTGCISFVVGFPHRCH